MADFLTFGSKLSQNPTLSLVKTDFNASTATPPTTNTTKSMLESKGAIVEHTDVQQVKGQLADTPSKYESGALNFEKDRYRNIGEELISPTSGDVIDADSSRQLGEPLSDNRISSIFLSSQFPTDVEIPADADPHGDLVNFYSRFFLQSVQESQSEKVQIVETFTDYYAFFYGKRPPVYSFRGVLLNDENHKWTNDLMFFYENFFRGSQTVALGAQAYVFYSGRLISGFLLNLNIQEESVLYKGASFSFDVLVVTHTPLYFSADISSLITKARKFITDRATAISNQIAQINKSIAPGGSALTALKVVSGKVRPSNPKKKGEITTSAVSPDYVPPSMKAVG